MSEARVYRVGDLVAQLTGLDLIVESVTSDSMATPESEPANVFDHDASSDHRTAWVSSSTPGRHWIEMRLAGSPVIGRMQIVQTPADSIVGGVAAGASEDALIGTLREVQVELIHENSPPEILWRSSALPSADVIAAEWKPVKVSRLRVTIIRSTRQYQSIPQARIQEIVFPGFRTVGPQPVRLFPPLLRIKALSADSEYGLGYVKEKIFDGGISSDDATSWASADTPMPHWLELELSEPEKLTQVEVVNRPSTRIDELQVQSKTNRLWSTVFDQANLRNQSEIRIDLPGKAVDALRFVVKRSLINGLPRNVADIEEIIFPGYRAVIEEGK